MQNTNGPLAVITGVGAATTVTEMLFDCAVHPIVFVAVTLYKPPVDTVMASLVSPVFHRYDPKPLVAISDNLSPSHSVVFADAVIVTVGFALSITLSTPFAVHPLCTTVTVSDTVPIGPLDQSTLILFVPCPCRNVPPATLHA